MEKLIDSVSTFFNEETLLEHLHFEQQHILDQFASCDSLSECLEALTESISYAYPHLRACIVIANSDQTEIADCLSFDFPKSFCRNLRGEPFGDTANADEWTADWKELLISYDVLACYSNPIFNSSGKAIGSILLCLNKARAIDEKEKHIAGLSAKLAAVLIGKDAVQRELQQSKEEIEEELTDARLLQRLSMELIREEETPGLYQKIMDAAVIIMQSQYASMQVLYQGADGHDKLKLLASSGFSPEAKDYWQWVYHDTDSSCGAAYRAKTRVIIANMAECEFMQGTVNLPIYLAGGILAAQSTPLYSRNGKLLGMISTHWDHPHLPSERDLSLLDILARQAADLIERNQTMDTLRESEERLRALTTELESRVEYRTRELQRSNEDLQQFAHVASHDLKEPVRKIKTFSYRLQDALAETTHPDAELYLSKILSSAERMSMMIDGVLKYSTLNAPEGDFETVDLQKTITDIQSDLEILIQQKDARFKLEDLPCIDGAQVLIYQLFYNLINNSLKFIKENDKPLITISGKTISLQGIGHVQIQLSDNGVGFDPIHNKAIFDTFTRLHSRDEYDGTGLGLSLCRKIVELHHGKIGAYGEKNVGAVFTITLPLKQSKNLHQDQSK